MSDRPTNSTNPAWVLGLPRRSFLIGTTTVIVSGSAGAVLARAGVSGGQAGTDGYAQPGYGDGAAPAPDAASEPVDVAALAAVPSDAGIVLADSEIVLTRDPAGTVHAFSAICPHASCLVSEVTSAAIACTACHGSRFDPYTGDVISGPATQGLRRLPVEVQGERILVSVRG